MAGLTEKEIMKVRDELKNCSRPLFFFDDDADGLSSFLLLYRYVNEGRGVCVKTVPNIDEKFIRKVVEYDADKVFVLDVAQMKQEFVDAVKRPVIWIDHHPLQDLNKVEYFNPRKNDITCPTSNLCYDIVKQDIWIGMIGCVGDWFLPGFKDEFCEQYPDLLDTSITKADDALFESKIGFLAKIFGFVLKGTTKDAMKSVKVLTRIKTPYEILNQETPQGKYLYDRFNKVNGAYEELLQDIDKKVDEKDQFLVYTYPGSKMSFTGELSNEVLHKYPDKIIIIAREKSGEMRMSLRSRDFVLLPILEKALVGLDGYGGGHEHACGANVKKEQFETFLNRLREYTTK